MGHCHCSVEKSTTNYTYGQQEFYVAKVQIAFVQPIESKHSLSNANLTIIFGNPFPIIPESFLFQQALTKDAHYCSNSHWNEGEEAKDDIEMVLWSF